MAGGKGCWRLSGRREEVREEGFTRRLEAVRVPALSAVSALANSGL
jgi:hypothetical protein